MKAPESAAPRPSRFVAFLPGDFMIAIWTVEGFCAVRACPCCGSTPKVVTLVAYRRAGAAMLACIYSERRFVSLGSAADADVLAEGDRAAETFASWLKDPRVTRCDILSSDSEAFRRLVTNANVWVGPLDKLAEGIADLTARAAAAERAT